MKTVGIILLVIGIALITITSINYFTREKVVDIGKFEVTHKKPDYIIVSPVIGVVLVIGAGLLLWRSSGKTR